MGQPLDGRLHSTHDTILAYLKSNVFMPTSFPRYFPAPHLAGSEGFLGYDPRLSTPRLLDAYRHGIFPWPWLEGDHWHVGWFSPDPRAILPLTELHIPARLHRKLKHGRFLFTWNHRFETVLSNCATASGRSEHGTWLSDTLQTAVLKLHRLGHAHSIEVYDAHDPSTVCGGAYGITTGGATFSAESMFHTVSDASKAAVIALVKLLNRCGYRLLDVQQASPHIERLGGTEISRNDYLRLLSEANNIVPRRIECQDTALRFDGI